MKEVVRARVMAARFRHLVVADPANAVRWLEEAQKWQQISEEEIASHFQECNTTKPIGGPSRTTTSTNAHA